MRSDAKIERDNTGKYRLPEKRREPVLWSMSGGFGQRSHMSAGPHGARQTQVSVGMLDAIGWSRGRRVFLRRRWVDRYLRAGQEGTVLWC